jgi:cysteinyl-tRNA synthetase
LDARPEGYGISMELRLYDTLTREKRVFTPLDRNNVRMYVCGPTVYDFAHIGNARPVIVFDVLFRLLRHLYGENHVTYVRNITDVDDKINDRAARDFPGLSLNEAIRKVTEQTEKQFHDDVDALGCLRPTVEPRATEHIAEMREIIERLVKGGFAYVAEDHVLFSPQAMNTANKVLPRYGALANRSLDEMIAGARVDVAPYKRDVTDFVLWKPSKPGEPSWPSPAGIKVEGRPGWHIECSAMSWKHLGEEFDIHGGGIDLVFPHHENELAQSCCAFHRNRMAHTWMHNGFLQVEGEKMSKSLGNFVTIRDLLQGTRGLPWMGDAIRLAMLMTHYSQPINWTEEKLAIAGANLHTFKNVGKLGLGLGDETSLSLVPEIANGKVSEGLIEALADDLNTPSALLSHLFSLVKAADQKGGIRAEPSRQLLTDCLFLGLDPFRYTRDTDRAYRAHKRIDEELVNNLISARAAARARKDFKESDRIRDELAAMGVVLKDGKDADGKPITTWEIAR